MRTRANPYRSAYQRAYANAGAAGPDIPMPTPFAPGTVTAAAGVAKILTAIASGRRAEANFKGLKIIGGSTRAGAAKFIELRLSLFDVLLGLLLAEL